MAEAGASVLAGVIAATLVAAFALSAAGIRLLLPWLRRHTVVHPNARSSHTVPTPQGGGIAVVVATLICGGAAILVLSGFAPRALVPFAPVLTAFAVLAVLGAVDDFRSLQPVPRLLLQIAAVALVILTLPPALHVLPALPLWAERVLMILGGVWFVNAVNFMDGLDWMTVAEVVPVTLGLVAIGLLGVLAPAEIALATALGGAMLGFAPFNRPVAKIFLGDVGSLPVGLLLGTLLLLVAARGHLAAALLLPLYYLADAGLTLLRRLARGEKVWEAHRTHFYQRATTRGLRVSEIVARVFATNLLLAVLAAVAVAVNAPAVSAIALAVGAAAVAFLLTGFARGRKDRAAA